MKQKQSFKAAFDAIEEIRSFLNHRTLPASSGFNSASDGLRNLSAAGVAVTNQIIREEFINSRKLKITVLLRETGLGATASAVMANASAALAVYPTLITVLFADFTSQKFKVKLVWSGGDLPVNLVATKFAYDANGNPIPLVDTQLDSITFLPGQIDGQSVLEYLDSLDGVRVTQWNPPGGWGGNAGCIAVQCKNESHSNGRPGVSCNPRVLDMCE